ncbi:VOC family protein [Neobacillus sp. NPDC058068]|uniref:VOC family protein n=1 Tax=Neobacillus sp. NPDC058068 TaxID=3346325 RepID=UPI0036DE17E5
MSQPIEMFVIAARDGNQAKSFYENLFNWKIIDAGPLLQISGAGISGHILKWPHKDHPTHVSIYVKVDNIQECLKTVEEMGGTVILPEMKVPTGGSIAQFVDPSGNIVGAYSGAGHKNSQISADNISENQFGFFDIGAREGNRSQKFYEKVFNWRITDDGPVMNIAKEDAGLNGIIYNWTREEPTYLTIYMKVADISACLEKVTQLGGKVIIPETAVQDFGTYAQFLDLDGNVIGIYKGW